MLAHRTVWALTGLAALQGCATGDVMDAFTGQPITGAIAAVVSGTCTGTGCQNPATAATNGSGSYVFDAFDPADRQLLRLSPGEETLSIEISKPGYQTVTLHHRPSYLLLIPGQLDSLFTRLNRVYLCALGSPDSDGDSLCDDAEARYGTNPLNSDSDGDNLSDAAELFGYNGVDLSFFGASPLRKDLFVEVDYYPGLRPNDAALQTVVESFSAAPVMNPSGEPGINLVVDLSDELAPADADPDLSPVWAEFDTIKNNYFPPRRQPIFHYSLFANQYDGSGFSGLSRGAPAQDFLVTLGTFSTPGGTIPQQAGTFMHELGHNIGLLHGGNDNWNYKPNYLSVMSYNYQLWGLRVNNQVGVFDYSRLRIDELDETNLNEFEAMQPVVGSTTTESQLADYSVLIDFTWVSGTASENLDFNNNGVIEASVGEDLDQSGAAVTTFPPSQNDWDSLVFGAGGSIGDSFLGVRGVAERRSVIPPEMMARCMLEVQTPVE